MLFIVFFESFALQRLLLAKYQPQHKYNEIRGSYSDILLSIADFRIAGKEISGSSRNVNKQGQRKPGRFLYFFHYQSFLVVLKYQILTQKPANTAAKRAIGSAYCG